MTDVDESVIRVTSKVNALVQSGKPDVLLPFSLIPI